MSLETSLEDRAWPAWVWNPQDRSVVAANKKARDLWGLAPATPVTGFLFPAKSRVTRQLHGAAVALLAGADQVQIDIKLPFAPTETWQCRRLDADTFQDPGLLLEAPQHGLHSPKPGLFHKPDPQSNEPDPLEATHALWQSEALNAIALPVIMIAADGKILHLNQEADRLAPSDTMIDGTDQTWSRPWHFRDFFAAENDISHALVAMAEAHRMGSASFVARLLGVPGYPGGQTQIMVQRVGTSNALAPLMVTFHKLAQMTPHENTHTAFDANRLHDELLKLDITAFELDRENRVVFFTDPFASWLARDPQDIGGRKIADLGVTPATGAGVMNLRSDTWEDGRYMIRRADGTISTMNIASLALPAANPQHARRLCFAKAAGKNPSEKKVSPQITRPPKPSPDLSVENQTPPTDALVSLFLKGVASESHEQTSDNLIRLDDWREGDEIVLTDGSFRALIESLDACLLGLDEKGTIVLANKGAETLLDKPVASLEGQPLATLFRARSAARLERFLDKGAEQTGPQSDQTLVLQPRYAASKKDALVVKLHTLREKSPIRYCVFLKSGIDKKPQIEENAPGGPALTKRRADFVARMSHEIRTPLNAILGFSDLMLAEGLGPIGNDKYKEYMQDIHDSGHLILSLINDILDLAKVDAEGIDVDLKGLDLKARIDQALSMLAPQAETKGVNLKIETAGTLPIIFADERSVMQILLNLITNALKFTNRGGTIYVCAQPLGKDYVSLKVADTGIGMTPEDIERALTPFQQASTNDMVDTSQAGKGTGLGLPITRALAHANHAKFQIESQRNKGTCVEILFNRARVAAE